MPSTDRRRDSTVELSRIGNVYGTRNYSWRQSQRVWTNLPTAKFESWVASCRRCERTRRQSWSVYNFLCCWASRSYAIELVTMLSAYNVTSLLKKLPVSLRIHVVNRHVQFLNCPLNPSAFVVSYCKFSTHRRAAPTPTRRDSTVESRRQCVFGFSVRHV